MLYLGSFPDCIGKGRVGNLNLAILKVYLFVPTLKVYIGVPTLKVDQD